MLQYKSSLILSLYLAIISVGHSPLLAGEQVVARLNNMSNREIEAYVRLKGDHNEGLCCSIHQLLAALNVMPQVKLQLR